MGYGSRIILFALVAGSAISALGEQRPNDEPPHRGRGEPELTAGPSVPARGNRMIGWRRFWLERDDTTTDSLGLRAAIREELRQVPTFEKHLKEFFAIQRERIELERERHNIALRGDRPTQEQLIQFHALLGREDQLASRSADLMKNIRADRQKIEQEIKARLEQIEAQSISNTDERRRRGGELRDGIAAQRWRRFYSTVLGHLDALENSSSAGEWFGTVVRSLWQYDRRNEPTLEGAARQLERLQREQEELRRRLDEVQSELDDLAEVLGSIQIGRSAPGPIGPAPRQGSPATPPVQPRDERLPAPPPQR